MTAPPRQWDDVGLGERPDTHIAAETGVSAETVRRQRIARGIPRAPAATYCYRGGNRDKPLEDHLDKLGTMPDAELGRLAGCTRQAVQARRRALGIPPYGGEAEAAQDVQA